MKSKNTTPKLISKREFNRRKVALQEKHAWLIKDNSFDIRPGWIHLLDNTLTKIKSSLNKEDIEESRLVFLYTGTRSKLQIFVEGVKLSPRRLKLIDHLIDSAALDSELTCPKCGHVYISRGLFRSAYTCEAHREFDGDFSEDQRRYINLKKQENEFDPKGLDEEDDTKATEEDKKAATAPINVLPTETDGPLMHLYNVEDVIRIKDSLNTRSADSDCRNRLKAICEEMIKRGGYRPYCQLPEPKVFIDLIQRFPNFKETIELVCSSVALAKLGDGRLEIPPLLLIGPPGIGKTQVANEIASLIKTDFLEVHIESEQNGATIAGSSEFWGNTQTGLIFRALTSGKTANPVVLVDELDKAAKDSRFDPLGGLYSLLERETAKRFEDQSIRGLPIDASGIIWVMTANDERLIPEPILSRAMVHYIRPPTREESIPIAQSIYNSIRKSRPWGDHFSPGLGIDVAEKLAGMHPRRMKVCLLSAFGQAAIAARDYLCIKDVPIGNNESTRIGFI
ncbi:AAA family ATPase [Methylovorus sp. SPW-M1]